MKRQLKKSVVYSLYVISFALLVGGIVGLGMTTKEVSDPKYEYVSKGILDYEENIKVCLCHFQRPEMKFSDMQALAKQIEQDVQFTKSYFMI